MVLSQVLRVKTKGTRIGLVKVSLLVKDTWKIQTYVSVSSWSVFKTLSLFCSKVSLANWGSSLIEILYRDTIYVIAAIASVSANLVELPEVHKKDS